MTDSHAGRIQHMVQSLLGRRGCSCTGNAASVVFDPARSLRSAVAPSWNDFKEFLPPLLIHNIIYRLQIPAPKPIHDRCLRWLAIDDHSKNDESEKRIWPLLSLNVQERSSKEELTVALIAAAARLMTASAGTGHAAHLRPQDWRERPGLQTSPAVIISTFYTTTALAISEKLLCGTGFRAMSLTSHGGAPIGGMNIFIDGGARVEPSQSLLGRGISTRRLEMFAVDGSAGLQPEQLDVLEERRHQGKKCVIISEPDKTLLPTGGSMMSHRFMQTVDAINAVQELCHDSARCCRFVEEERCPRQRMYRSAISERNRDVLAQFNRNNAFVEAGDDGRRFRRTILFAKNGDLFVSQLREILPAAVSVLSVNKRSSEQERYERILSFQETDLWKAGAVLVVDGPPHLLRYCSSSGSSSSWYPTAHLLIHETLPSDFGEFLWRQLRCAELDGDEAGCSSVSFFDPESEQDQKLAPQIQKLFEALKQDVPTFL